MACWTMETRLTPEQRRRELAEALAKVERELRLKRVRVKIGPQGAIAFDGWSEADRRGLTDVCTVRKLRAKGSAAFRTALAEAERSAGRKANLATVGAGIHSHDGGKSWQAGH